MDLLKEAEEFRKVAIDEFSRSTRRYNGSIKVTSDKRIRDSAEKAWNSVVQATDFLIATRLGGDEREAFLQNRGYLRTRTLYKLAKYDREIRDEILPLYELSIKELHENAFYLGLYEPEIIKAGIDKAKKYISKVKELAKNGHRN